MCDLGSFGLSCTTTQLEQMHGVISANFLLELVPLPACKTLPGNSIGVPLCLEASAHQHAGQVACMCCRSGVRSASSLGVR